MRYAILAIVSFICLMLWAGCHYLDSEGQQKETEVCKNYVALLVDLDGNEFSKVEKGMCYLPDSLSLEFQAETNESLDSLANYLKIQNHRMLRIQGSFQESEKDTRPVAKSSLGVDRAQRIKSVLVEKGISRPRLILSDTAISNNIPNFIKVQIITDPD